MLSRDNVRQMMPPYVGPQEDEAYTSIRDECVKRIQTVAQEGKECCTYVVSPIHFGLPVYDPDEVFMRLYNELNEHGYQLMAWPTSRRLLISWFVDEQTAISNLQNALDNE